MKIQKNKYYIVGVVAVLMFLIVWNRTQLNNTHLAVIAQQNRVTDSVDLKMPTFCFYPTQSNNSQLVIHNNFTLSYVEEHEQSEWVAYELKADHLKINHHFKRPNFKPDPYVITNSAGLFNYKKSGYDRGHLCPAADRKMTLEAYCETFYMSNVAPQDPEFNRGDWKKLEEKVRYWAVKWGHLFVVTGGVLEDQLPTIGKEQVSVPNYFYKVLLDTTRGAPVCIAFLMPNKKTNKPLYEYVVSVDSIEKLTGLDFFYKFPKSVQERIESNQEYKKWSFSKEIKYYE
jgi:endonuclease G, mitochondrial